MKKVIAITIGVLFICFALFKTLFGPSGLIRQFAINGENHQLQIEIDSLQAEIIKKNKQIEGLQKNLFIIEEKARTEMGMTKKGEIVFRFRESDSSKADSSKIQEANK